MIRALCVAVLLAVCTRPKPAVDAGPPAPRGNHLSGETSPYLLQHAENPVDWYPWGEEAFAKARRENKPVLVSIGYSSCHWCHVMARETFEDAAFAAWLNEHFVAIKVDREERPDVDAVYIAAAQQLGSGGGWPLNVVVTPSREVFWAATYRPRARFLDELKALHARFAADPLGVATQAGAVTEALRAREVAEDAASSSVPSVEALKAAARFYAGAFDPVNGGLKRAPKFPSHFPVRFLLRYARRFDEPKVLPMAELTLEKMAAGGIYDQVGGGFHRYSTDAQWLVPHFEKTLYDNALLPVAYLEAYQVTGRRDFARVARETLDWVAAELGAPSGGFYSATDADSEGVEGRYFLWNELDAGSYFALAPPGVVWVPKPDETVRPSLLSQRAVRSRRAPPARDEKVVTSWNGLAVSAFAFGARVLNEPRYLELARGAVKAVLKKPLVHAGRAEAVLEDHAFLIQGLIDLYEADHDVRWLDEARALQTEMDAHFADAKRGGWFRTRDDSPVLLVRGRCDWDGAEPCGASVAALNLLRLHELTGEQAYADTAARAHEDTLKRSPEELHELLLALDFFTEKPRELAIVGPDAGALVEVVRSTFLPNTVTWVGLEAGALPWLEGKRALGGAATAYVCTRGQCELPAKSADVLRKQLR